MKYQLDTCGLLYYTKYQRCCADTSNGGFGRVRDKIFLTILSHFRHSRGSDTADGAKKRAESSESQALPRFVFMFKLLI